MKNILKFLLATMFTMMVGMMTSLATGVNLAVTITGALVASNFVMPVIHHVIPNVMRGEVVLTQAFEQQLLKGLKSIKDDFLARIPDRSDLVGNDVLNLTKAGVKPNVLIDNTTYPIAASQRVDTTDKLALRKLTTEVTVITEDELYALPYDKKGDVNNDHKLALQEEFRKLALHSFCPTANTSTTIVLSTSGANDGNGRLRLTKDDLIKFRKKLDDLGVGVCDLVLCNDHCEDILLWSEVFANQYQAIASGLILPMYGFNISQNQGYAPTFNSSTKNAYGATVSAGDVKASVAYLPERMLKGYGSVKMYYKDAEPRYHQSEVNYDAHFIAIPKDTTGTGAIISGIA